MTTNASSTSAPIKTTYTVRAWLLSALTAALPFVTCLLVLAEMPRPQRPAAPAATAAWQAASLAHDNGGPADANGPDATAEEQPPAF